MINAVLAIMAALIGIIGGILERRYAKDAINKRARKIYNNDQTIKFVNETKSLAGTLGLNFEA